MVKNAKYSDVKREIPPIFFIPYRQDETIGQINFYVRTAEDPEAFLTNIPKVIARLDSNLPVENLSGGNQQKVVFARCLLTDPRLLLCDEPTRGIDEGAKQQIFQIIDQFVSSGRAAIVVSSELEEILQISDRIIVFRSGRMAGEVSRAEASQEVLTSMAA